MPPVPRPPRDKRIPLMAKVLPDIDEALGKKAAEDNRSKSNTVETIILAWFREHRPDLLPADFSS